MREILFRGKRIDNGEWVYGSFCMDALEQKNGLCGVDGFIRLYDPAAGKMQMHEVDRETVGQYTGLTDKNGKKIYEGDLCLCNRNINSFVDNQVFLISWDTEYGQWVGSSSSSNIVADEFSMCEVIGNIQDNPELLEEG